MNFKRQLKIPRTCFGSCAIHHQGVRELCLTEITRGGSQIFFVCLVGVWQRNFEPVVCVVCTVRRAGNYGLLPRGRRLTPRVRCIIQVAPHNDVSVNEGPHIRRWSHNIIILYYNTYHCVTIAYSIQYSNMLYRFVA